jgi:hypothetical protein
MHESSFEGMRARERTDVGLVTDALHSVISVPVPGLVRAKVRAAA